MRREDVPGVSAWMGVALPDLQGVSRAGIRESEPVRMYATTPAQEEQDPLPVQLAPHCRTCEGPGPRLIAGECRTCYEYRRRTGQERPERLIVAYGRRFLERELERRLHRIA